MIVTADWPGRRFGAFGELGRWSFAALVVIGLHGGALTWYLRDRPVPLIEGGAPPAIMIELAPLPEATDTSETLVSQDTVDSEASAATEAMKAPEPEQPEPVVEEPPIEEPPPEEPPPEELRPDEPMPEETPEPVPDPVDVPQEAEVALPMERSPRPPPRPERREAPAPEPARPRDPPKPKPQDSAAAAEAAAKARNDAARASERDAGAKAPAGAGRAMSPARWQNLLFAHLERHKPRSRGERGSAYVSFTIDASGKVLSVRLARGSGNAALDEAALTTVRRASPVPAPPPGAPTSLTVEIKFDRR